MNHLRTEIQAHKDTIRLMEGIKPESIEDDQFRLLLPHNDDVEAYQAEAIDTIQRITNDISAMKSQIAEFESLKSELNTRIQSLAIKIHELKPEHTIDHNKDSLQVEIDELQKRYDRLTETIETNGQTKKQLASELASVKEQIQKETEFEQTFLEKSEYLRSRKKQMEQFENIEQAMNVLEERISHINSGIAGNQYFTQMAEMILKDIESLNESLTLKVEAYLLNIHKYMHLLLLRHNF